MVSVSYSLIYCGKLVSALMKILDLINKVGC